MIGRSPQPPSAAAAFAAALAFLVCSCGSSSSGPTGPADSSTEPDVESPGEGGASLDQSAIDSGAPSEGSSLLDSGSPADAAACVPPTTFGGGETNLLASSVTAKIVDDNGAPVPGQPVYICGVDICSPPGITQADGTVTIKTSLTEKKPAFKVGDGINYNEIAIPLQAGATDFTSGGSAVLTVGELASKPGAVLGPGTTATSGDVSIAIPSGATVGIDALTYDTPTKRELRTVRIPLANDGPVLASSGVTGFALLYGLAPAETLVCPPASVTVALPHGTRSPNDFGWAPGDAVEFWVMTTDVAQTYAPYAGWAKISDGVVAADGQSVTTAGQGFAFLESFAIRKP